MTLSQNLGKQTLPGANAKYSSDFCQLNYVIIEKISIAVDGLKLELPLSEDALKRIRRKKRARN